MLASKKLKIILSLCTLLFLVFLISPTKTFATTATFKLLRTANQYDETTQKWSWSFGVWGTNIPDTADIYFTPYSGNKALTSLAKSVKLENNQAHYDTGFNLAPGTPYSVIVIVNGFPDLGINFPAEVTPTDGKSVPNPPAITKTATIGEEGKEVKTKTNYTLLAPLPGLTEINTEPTTDNPCPFGTYLNLMIKIFLGICAVLAMIMIVWGGIQYMTSDLASSKEEGKKYITNAVLGLILALGSYAILNTLNPDLLNICLDKSMSAVSITIEGDTDEPIGGTNVLPTGIVCSGGRSNIPNIAKSFANKMTYKMGAKGVAGPNNTIMLDCSGFTNYVLKCAGVPFVNGGTASIFNGAEKVTSISGDKVNNKQLKVGDLVGWKAGDITRNKYGHVMVYIGDGQVRLADSHGGSTVGNALGVFPITNYKNDIKYIKRAP